MQKKYHFFQGQGILWLFDIGNFFESYVTDGNFKVVWDYLSIVDNIKNVPHIVIKYE